MAARHSERLDCAGSFPHEVKDSVKAVSVDEVAPSEATVKDGSYAVQRPFILVTKKDTKLSENAQKFFDYITSEDANEVISGAGVVPAN